MTKLTYLWGIALVALCLSVGPTMALAADSWTVDSQIIPSVIEWDKAADASVDVLNIGTTTWNSTFGLASVQGVTTAAVPINRWGLTLIHDITISGTAPTFDFLYEFTITGPPITSLKYDLPVTATGPGSVAAFDCNWILVKDITPTSTTPITSDTAERAVAVSRFPDVQPSGVPLTDEQTGSWARFWIEELAGNIPLVVQGFPDGSYRPLLTVTRDQMAVFMARALKLTLPPFQDKFTDVPEIFWARPWIEALVDSDIVQGFSEPGGTATYRPDVVVTRDQMAVFVARGIAGGESSVPTGPDVATFPDVPTEFWAFKYVEFAVDMGVVQGFPDDTYRPALSLDRAQMAVFVWRSFIMPSQPGSVVVLAGPAVTAVDVANADYIGYTSAASGPQADPGFAYIGFDAVRLGTGLVFPDTPTGTWDVEFELLPAASATPAATQLFMVTAAQVLAARDAAFASGDPYVFLVWDIPAGLDAGNYTLLVSAADETGALNEIKRQPNFRIE
jgi:hypothetical protein